MTCDEFMELWRNKSQERTIIITDDDIRGVVDGLHMIVCFPPDRFAVASIDFLDDRSF